MNCENDREKESRERFGLKR